MNFQDAGFPASFLSPFRDHLSCGNGGEISPSVRGSTATQHINLQAEMRGLDGNTNVNYGIQSRAYAEHVTADQPCLVNQGFPPENQTRTSINEVSLNCSSSGQNSTVSSKASIAKRNRTTFSPSQLNRLENEFRCSMYVVGLKRMRLAEELKLDERQVKIWFQNRRMKHKREQQNIERKAVQFPHYYSCY